MGVGNLIVARSGRNDDDLFIPRAVVTDTRISHRARGLLCFLLAFDGEGLSVEDAQGRSREGKEAHRSAWRELVQIGCVLTHKRRENNGQWSYKHYVFDRPFSDALDAERNLEDARVTWARCAVCGGTQPNPPPTGVITYVVQRGKYVKIGKTRALSRRLNVLGRELPGVVVPEDFDPRTTLVLLGTTEEPEHLMHERFARWHSKGEWFEAHPKLIRSMQDVLSA